MVRILLEDAEDAGGRLASLLAARHRRLQDPAIGVVDGNPLAAQRNDRHDRLAGATRFNGGGRAFAPTADGACMICARDQQGETRKGKTRGPRPCLLVFWVREARRHLRSGLPNCTQERHNAIRPNLPIETTIMPWPITIAAFSSATFPDDTAGSPRRWTMDFASPQSPRRSKLDGFFATAPNSSAPASSFFPIVGSGLHLGSHLGADQSARYRARRCQRPTPRPRQLHLREQTSIGVGDRSASATCRLHIVVQPVR